LYEAEDRQGRDVGRIEAGKNSEIERMRQDYDYLTKRYAEVKQENLDKDTAILDVENQAKLMLQQA
jgi:hypothetical protein